MTNPKTILMSVKLFLAVLLVVLLGALLTNTLSAAPVTFTVTNTNDSGAGSLRQAIIDANSNNNPTDMDVIEFNIPGNEVHTIELDSDLPLITQKVTIDGYSQPGAQENTAPSPQPMNSVIRIEIDGSQATIAQGVIGVTADDTIIQGLAIFDGAEPAPNYGKANVGFAGANAVLRGSYIGVKADGVTLGEYDKNCFNIGVFSDSTVGGTAPADRNIIGGSCSIAQSASVFTNGSGSVYGNYIGIARDGITDLTPDPVDVNGLQAPFAVGINLLGDGGAVIGGSAPGMKNVISGNTVGISVSSPNNTIQGNYIGTDYTGQTRASITNGMGIVAATGTRSLIGGTGSGEGNLVAGVQGSGVEIASMTVIPTDFQLTAQDIAVIGNSIHSIRPFNLLGIGSTNLGIDISRFIDTVGDFTPDQFEDRGPNLNDEGDTDEGPNHQINYPVLKTAQQVGNQLTITYDLDAASSPSNTYRLEFFANNERTIFGYGPGEAYLGAVEAATPGTDQTATITVSGNHANKALSATTTAINTDTDSGFGSTSEFAQNISIGSAEDFDSDGIPDEVEDGAPNNGDGNNDGIPDRLQPTVTSFPVVNGSSGVYATLVTEGCSENGTVSSLRADSLQATDQGFAYPFGLTDFTLYCSRGDEVDVTLYIHTDENPEQYMPRKYNPNTDEFFDIPGAILTAEKLGESTALKLNYSITDGGELDDTGEENGIIVDPVGLAKQQDGVLATTGIITALAVPMGLLLIFGASYTYIDYRRHKKPLLQADASLARSYTYWHHLRVVSIPLARYRMTIHIEKKETLATPGVG